MPNMVETISTVPQSTGASPGLLAKSPETPTLVSGTISGADRSGIGNLLITVWIIACVLGAAGALAILARHIRQVPAGQLVHEVLCLHIPMAANTFVAGGVAFIAGIMFLLDRSSRWDDLGVAAAKVAVVLCTGVLLTGMFWTRCARNEWWSWTPHQTFSLLLWLLYLAYLILRAMLAPQSKATVCAAYGVIAFLDVPLVYLSANLMPESSAVAVSMAGPLKLSLAVWFVPVTMITVGLIVARYRLSRRERVLLPVGA